MGLRTANLAALALVDWRCSRRGRDCRARGRRDEHTARARRLGLVLPALQRVHHLCLHPARLLQDFFLPRLLRLTRGPGTPRCAAAAMFSLAHLPNPILTVITFVWGLMACLFFLRYRNLYPLAVAHTILGITVAMTYRAR